MLKTSDCYYELKTRSEVIQELSDWCRAQTGWSQWRWTTFMLKEAPLEIIEQDTVIRTLLDNGWRAPFIMKNYPHSFYNFHVDKENRPAAINLLLDDNVNSHTYFLGESLYKAQFRALELKYRYGYYYLLNTHIKHGVFNLQKDRYIFSISPPAEYIPEWWDEKAGKSKDNIVTRDSLKVFSALKLGLQELKL